MPTPVPPSLLWATYPTTPPAVDAPIQQDATFVTNPGAQRTYNSYLDSQIRAASTHLVQSLVGGLTGTICLVDPQSPQIAIGQWVCLAGSIAHTVTLATLTALAAAGLPVGIALTAGVPGGIVRIAMEGIVPPSVTGLLIGSNLYAVVNTATGFTSTVASLGSNSYPVGTVDAAANLNVRIFAPPAPGGSGLTITGTGFWPVVGGVPGSVARAVNLASNGTNGDVTGLLPFINGGHLQGDINVTHASPGQFDATHQIAYCDTSTGTCQVTFPAASAFPGSVIPADWQVFVADTAGVAATNAITVNPNGESLWDPNAGAFGTSNVTLGGRPNTNGIVALWQWDANKLHWVLLDVNGSGSSTTNTPVRLSATHTLAVSELNIYANTSTASFPITFFASPTDGLQVSFYDDHLQFGTNPLTVTANAGQTVMDVNNPIATFGASTILRQTGSRTVFEYDGVLTRWSIA